MNNTTSSELNMERYEVRQQDGRLAMLVFARPCDYNW